MRLASAPVLDGQKGRGHSGFGPGKHTSAKFVEKRVVEQMSKDTLKLTTLKECQFLAHFVRKDLEQGTHLLNTS